MKLADWMAAHGLNDEKVAASAEVDRATISRVRRGVTKPSWDLAARLKAISGGAVTADDHLPATS